MGRRENRRTAWKWLRISGNHTGNNHLPSPPSCSSGSHFGPPQRPQPSAPADFSPPARLHLYAALYSMRNAVGKEISPPQFGTGEQASSPARLRTAKSSPTSHTGDDAARHRKARRAAKPLRRRRAPRHGVPAKPGACGGRSPRRCLHPPAGAGCGGGAAVAPRRAPSPIPPGRAGVQKVGISKKKKKISPKKFPLAAPQPAATAPCHTAPCRAASAA